MSSIHFDSIARHIPPRVMTNDEMSTFVDTSDEWISSRTGIRRRHFAAEGTRNSDQAIDAGRKALEKAGFSGSDISSIVLATFTPDMRAPATADIVAGGLGIGGDSLAFDVSAGCTGFLVALHVARGLLMQEPGSRSLVIASELISSVLDFGNRSTCVLFGDGAAAAVVSLDDGRDDYFCAGTQPDEDAIAVRAYHFPDPVAGISMHGQEVFRFACSALEADIARLLAESGLGLGEVDHIVSHQANARIISHVAKHLDADPAQFFMDVDEYGNTSAASIPMALAHMDDEGLLARGDKVMLVGFGAGLCHAGTLFEW